MIGNLHVDLAIVRPYEVFRGVSVFVMDQMKMKVTVDIDIYMITPDNSREVSEIDEFIDKVRQNINTAIFTINMDEKPLSEVADFLEMFVSEIEVPEQLETKLFL